MTIVFLKPLLNVKRKIRHTVLRISLGSGVQFQVAKILKFRLPNTCASFPLEQQTEQSILYFQLGSIKKAETYLEPNETSMIELFCCENS